ncbi:transketolase [Arcanobacterium pinnipediorum]|uniref:Transketolase n=1 Tax=Arcanobacterium pinnipediorum TaxID=1503041 RepID=A0ABY5AJ54_9ACTO|nr:transketolase [Arcanobacterium pinnipediorum]USR80237.1 transketolase [Arcanobacterium pinnipediorum]
MTSLTWTELDQQAVRYGRVLAADAVQKAGNGHPGTAISLAPAAYLLFHKVMRHDAADPQWLGRDRFVLSIGHSSLTLYTQLFYSGYGLELDDFKALRTYESQMPGHPEYGWTPGVEMTTGPLGQGLASAVGMAMAARRERGLFDPDAPAGLSPFDHFVYVMCGEGDLEEGVTSEASSLAGTQNLGNLIVIFDDNQISIEDDTVIALSEDILARYEAYGWHTQHVAWRNPDSGDYVEDVAALYNAIAAAQKVTDRPSIIKLSTIIAWPSPTKQNTGASHGAALGDDEVRGLKLALGLDPEAMFQMPEHVLDGVRANARQRSADARSTWEERFTQWRDAHPDQVALLERLQKRELPAGWETVIPTFEAGTAMATRTASGKVLTSLKDVLPELWGGSADLGGSNNTTMIGEPSFLPRDRSSSAFSGHEYGRTLHFGIREHAMGAILNGISLHGLTRPYGGTFFVFSDYMRPAVRLAALMHVPSIFVWTHDSVGVGEDGPTHQPIEHLWSYRAIPDFDMIRPADANETAYAWRGILERDSNPSGLILSRQNLPVFERGDSQAVGDTLASAAGVLRGGYVLADAEHIDVVLIATGSEVAVALEARTLLAAQGIGARVVSMPCIEWFTDQDLDYRESVIPSDIKARVSIEAGTTLGWHSIIGDDGVAVGIDHYGASANGNFLLQEYGMNAENVVAAAKESLSRIK